MHYHLFVTDLRAAMFRGTLLATTIATCTASTPELIAKLISAGGG